MQLEGIDIDINKLPAEARKEFLRYKIKLEEKRKESAIKNDFMSFVKYVWPDFIEGSQAKPKIGLNPMGPPTLNAKVCNCIFVCIC